MKCIDARTYLSEISDKSIREQIPQADLDFLSTNGYVSRTSKVDYDQAAAEVASLETKSRQVEAMRSEQQQTEEALVEDLKKTQGIMYHFQGDEKKQEEVQRVEQDRDTLSKEESAMGQIDFDANKFIQKKSALDRLVPLGEEYVALGDSGTIMLNDLSARNYRVADMEFSDFIKESKATTEELTGIAQRASSYFSTFHDRISNYGPTPVYTDEANNSDEIDRQIAKSELDESQQWSVAIGLAKLQGDSGQITSRFFAAMDDLRRFNSAIESKMMAAEIMTATHADFSTLSNDLTDLEQRLRAQANVAEVSSAGIAATLLYAKTPDETTESVFDKFVQNSRLTDSHEAAAILSITDIPSDQLMQKFRAFKSLFDQWGHPTSEDTDLASAYLAISGSDVDQVKPKLNTIVDMIQNDLQYPLVAAAILTSMSTLEAAEVVDLMEKGASILANYATGLGHSELISLAVRMVHGVNSELAKRLDPNASVRNTPVQFTNTPQQAMRSMYGGNYYGGFYGGYPFFWYYYPLIIAHNSYYTTYNRISGSHEAHSHGVGGFFG